MAPLSSSVYEQLAKEKPATGWPWKMFLFSLFIVVLVALAYFGMQYGYQPYLRSKIAQVDTDLNSLTSQIPQEDQDSFVSFYSQLTNLQTLLKKHVVASDIFSIIERNTESRVYFTSLDLSVGERRINLEGIASSYEVLATQLAGLSKVPQIQKYLLTESQSVDGKVRFRLNIFINPGVFAL